MMKVLLARLRALSFAVRLFLTIVVVVVALDQWTKYLAVAHLTDAFDTRAGEALSLGDKVSRFLWTEHPERAERVEVIENHWHFTYVENPGAAFGFLARLPKSFTTPFFLLVSLIAMVFIALYFRRTEERQVWLRVALALVFAGAVGNFLDRARLGYVIDFIDWHWFDAYRWPTFNVADAAISTGVVMMILDMFMNKPETVKAEPTSSPT